ncbi:CpaD family pilus assembly lipoprotein [Neomegalonema sp.]|uniref:CpaD family pilus assembly lipoprotein n=1 Tax=Neomegalonema sp. TaxID=2039713 RepID=UPI0026396C46|nr:CpaD family pilus assembly lipoprotein [Neomegalonema sp.]MDD2868841.1 CpaD family pilus assembly lipoprotein [Neomegalonema sp.]
MLGRLKPAALAGALAALLAGCSGSVPNGPEQAALPWQVFPPGATTHCPPAAEDMRLNRANTPSPSFGCATSVNMAAQIAYPSDLKGPQPMTAPDWPREERVLGDWREGELTQSSRGQTGTTSMIGN